MSDLQELLDELVSPDEARSQAARAMFLRRLDLPAAAVGVARLLGHKEPEVRRVAAQVIGDLGPAAGSAMPALVALLDDPSPRVREQAAFALAALGEGAPYRELTEALMKAAHDQAYEVRKAGTAGLHRLGFSGAAPCLVPPDLLPGEESEAERIPEWVSGLADQLMAHVTPRHSGWVLPLPVGDNRLQRVRLTINPARDTLTISTECGPIHPTRYGWALEQNLHLYPGCLALRRETKKGRHDELVLQVIVPLGEAFPTQTVELIRRLAQQGDDLEQTLTGLDSR